MAVAGFMLRFGARRLPSSSAATFLGRGRCVSFKKGVTAELASLRTEVAELRSALQEAVAHIRTEKEARRVQGEELQKLRSDFGEEKAKAERVAEQLALKVLVPEFCPDPTVPELQYSHGHR
eukprot:EG_transcript_51160